MAQSMRPSLNVVAVPGRVDLEDCSLDLIFFKLETYNLVFFLVTGAD